jgi:hypothetical protein
MAKIGSKEAQRRALREASASRVSSPKVAAKKVQRQIAVALGINPLDANIATNTGAFIARAGLIKRGRPALKLTAKQKIERVERKRELVRKRVQKHRARKVR